MRKKSVVAKRKKKVTKKEAHFPSKGQKAIESREGKHSWKTQDRTLEGKGFKPGVGPGGEGRTIRFRFCKKMINKKKTGKETGVKEPKRKLKGRGERP